MNCWNCYFLLFNFFKRQARVAFSIKQICNCTARKSVHEFSPQESILCHSFLSTSSFSFLFFIPHVLSSLWSSHLCINFSFLFTLFFSSILCVGWKQASFLACFLPFFVFIVSFCFCISTRITSLCFVPISKSTQTRNVCNIFINFIF